MAGIIFFSLLILGLSITPILFRLRLALWSSVFQIYTFPILSFYPSLALISHAALSPALLNFKTTLKHLSIRVLLAILFLQAISLLWSSDLRLGLATILYELPFIILYIVSFNVALQMPEKFELMIKSYAAFTVIPIFILLIFRFHFDLDSNYLQTSLAAIFINPNTLKNSPYAGNHIDLNLLIQQLSHSQLFLGRWLDKPHSFFMNPNTCAGYFGICSMLFWGASSYFKSTFLKVIACLHLLGLMLIFSVAATILSVTIPILLACIYFNQKKYLLSISLIGIFSIPIILFFFPQVESIVLHKIQARLVLWNAAISVFSFKYLLTGLGFGGWAKYYALYRLTLSEPLLQPNYPPHNTFIQLLFDSGLPALLLCLLFMYLTVSACLRAFRVLQTKEEKILALSVLGSFIWVYLQGMGENWGFLGEIHVQPILALMFGYLMSLSINAKQ